MTPSLFYTVFLCFYLVCAICLYIAFAIMLYQLVHEVEDGRVERVVTIAMGVLWPLAIVFAVWVRLWEPVREWRAARRGASR